MASANEQPDLTFVELRVADWERVVSWYVDVLGLTIVMSDPARRFALLQAGSSRLAIRAAGPGAPAAVGVRLTFRVNDVRAASERLRDLGVSVSAIKANRAEGYLDVRLTDPSGTDITLFEWGLEQGG